MDSFDLYTIVFYVVVFHLFAFGLSLLIMGLYAVFRSLFSGWRPFAFLFDWGNNRHLGEIRSIGREARAEMQVLYEDYLDLVGEQHGR